MKLGFIGLGAMGSGMATRILEARHTLTVYDKNPAQIDAVKPRENLRPASGAREVASVSDVVFLSLPPPDSITRSVCLDPVDGLLVDWSPGKILVDLGTCAPSLAVEIANQVERKRGIMLDAPVSGGPHGARNGSLSIMVGGPEETYEKLLPLLRLLGKDIEHVGPVGCGQAVKGVNQLVMGVSNAVFLEAIAYGMAYGVDPKKIGHVLANAGAGNVSFTHMANIAASGRAPFQDVKLLHLRRFVPDAQSLGLNMPASTAVLEAANGAPQVEFPENEVWPGWPPGPRPSYWATIWKDANREDSVG